VTTNVTGCREAVEPGVTGDLVQPRDSSSLAKALLSLIEDEQRQHSYGAKGQERAKAIFSVTSVVSQTLNIYDGVLRHDSTS
jgi:glycosyltransferase involved in cell wall biosynthesis